jgi:1-acyl-sn-glycerol-3-phosphate acyltransferase
LVFPGGDHECLRPLWRAREVDFAGRTGFLRIARDARVPIVPMGIRGSHRTAPLAGRSRWLANALVAPRLLYGTKRWGLTALGLAGALGLARTPWPLGVRALSIWLWLGSPLVFLPVLPATIGFRIGAPLEPEALFGADGSADLSAALARVQGAVQGLVDGR